MIDKIIESQKFIQKIVREYKKPCIFVSFGKDSIVLLHLLRTLDLNLPVIFYREPFKPKKYEYADKMIRLWDLNVYDYPPIGVGFDRKGDIAHTINYHQIKGLKNVARMTGLVAPQNGEDYLCVLNDLIERPRGNYCFPWDVCFHGHKSSDIDPVRGAIPLRSDVLKIKDSSDMAYPLKDWTDKDVWQYIEENKIPINYGRYVKGMTGWEDVKDKTLNSDYFAACWKCVDRSEAETVFCPKQLKYVPNVSSQVHYDELNLSYLGK